jgi:hypothetical protein
MDKMGTVEIEEDQEERIPDLIGDDILNMKGFLFHGMVFFFDEPNQEHSNGMEIDVVDSNSNTVSIKIPPTSSPSQAIARFGGAHLLHTEHTTLSSVPSDLKSTITHIIAHHDSDLKDLRRQVSIWEARKIPRIMSQEWIEVCWKEGTRVAEEGYIAR